MHKVTESAVIPADVERVWAVVGRFEALADWLPAMISCALRGGSRPESVGAMRELVTRDGAHLIEVQIARHEAEHSYSYAMTECPLPVHNYRSTIALKPITASAETFMEWSASFEPEPGKADEMTKLIRTIYQTGLRALQKRGW